MGVLKLIPEETNSQKQKRPILFISTAHIGQLSVHLRTAEQFAIETPDTQVIILSTDDVANLISTYTSRIDNLSFKSFGKSSSIKSELTQYIKKQYVNGPTPFPLLEIAVRVEKEHPAFPETFEFLVALFKDINPRLALIDVGCPAAFDAASYVGLQFITVIPTFASYGMRDDYAVSALSVGHAYSGTNAREPTLGSVFKSLYHRYMFPMAAIYSILFRGLSNERACNWGIEYPVRFRPNVHMVGPIMPEVKPFGNSPSDNDLELFKWIDSDDRGIIFISLGSLNIMENWEIIQFVEQLAKVVVDRNVRVIWKFTKSKHEFITKELGVYKVSQDDFKVVSWVDNILGLLGHSKIVLNINHAGGNSLNEALFFGIPQLWIPLWVDCYDLAVRGDAAGIGISVDCKKSYKGVGSALEKMFADESYRRNAKFWSERCKVDGGRAKVISVINNLITELEIEEKYGLEHKSMNHQTNKVITDPPSVHLIFFGLKLVLFAFIFWAGWTLASWTPRKFETAITI
ncbi:hypothetical protein HK098_005154 [Nowakowskiella sp. JEL0407]|nr:hypothetical protein HK098_005154 [Nowakowskiella sp. JEL0407]